MADRTVKAILKADVSSLVAGMKQAEASTKSFAKNATDSATKNRAAWESTGKGMMVAGGVIAAGLVVAVKSFMDFDQSMSRAQAGTMATGASLKELRAAAIDAGAKTQFSAIEAAQAITAMGKAGVSTKDILKGGLTGALSLAAAGQLDVAQASEIAATAMNQFGLEGKDIPHIADLLAAGAGKAMGSVQDLAGALKYVGPTAKGMGVSIEETTGTLAMFAQKGILGEQAGTSMRSMLLTLTSPSAIVAKRMEDLGINVYDASGQFIGLEGAAGELQAKLGPLDDATRNAALGQIFGNEAVGAARILYEGGAPAVAKWTAEVNDAGFAAEQAAMLTDNLKGDVEELGGSLSSVLIESGSGANGMLRIMTTELQGVIDRYGSLPVPVQQGALALGAVTAAALLAGGSLVTLVPKAIAAKAALTAMGRSGAIAATAIKGLGIASAVALVGLPILDAAASKVSGSLGQLAPDAIEAGRALTEFANGGKASGDSAELINRHFGDLSDTINNVFSPELGHKVSAFFSEISPGNRMGFETSATNQAIEFFKTLDSGLATMVASGNGEKAVALLKRVTDEATKQGYSVKQVGDALPTYTAAITSAGEAAAIEAGSQATATGAKLTGAAASAAAAQAEKNMTTAAEENKKAHDALTASITGYGSAMLSARGDARSYEAAIDAATASLKENGKTLDITTEKGRNNQTALDGIATSALKAAESNLGLAEQNGKLGTATKTVTGDINTARQAFIDQAVAMGMPKKAAEALATQSGLTAGRVKEITDKLIDLGKQAPSPTVGVNGVPAALAKIASVEQYLSRLHDKTITIHEVRTTIDRQNSGRGVPKAAGGYVRGAGTTTSDSINARLSDKEYVVKAKAVDYYGVRTMDAINSMRFAAGGYAGSAQSASSGSAPMVDMGGVRADLAEQTQILRTLIPGFGAALDRQAQTIQTTQRQYA